MTKRNTPSTQKKHTGKKSNKTSPSKHKSSSKKHTPAGPSFLRRLFTLALNLTVIGIIGFMLLLGYYAHDLPDFEQKLEAHDTKRAITLIALDGTPLLAQGQLRGAHVDAGELPSYFIDALVATEDRRFFNHHGIDYWGLARAMVTNLRAGSIVQGGSTLTQQLAKNLFLSSERTIKRKIQEVMLALWLEQKFSKEEILTLYLNRVYFGAGAYGVDAASHLYFGKSSQDLTLSESAMLVGLLKAPSKYSPASNPKLAKARAEQVLINMKDAGLATDGMLHLAKSYPAKSLDYSAHQLSSRYFSDWVLGQLPELIGYPDRDLRIQTTLHDPLQNACHEHLQTILTSYSAERKVTQGAIILMSRDGAIRCMVGGGNYKESQYNRATQAERQPGSAFKFFVYLAALEAGWHPNHLVEDSPITVGKWTPSNYSHDYRGAITLTEALVHSINTIAVKLSEWAGRDAVREMAQRLGVLSEISPHPSLALGASELTLMELTTAYAHMARQGYSVWPYGITRITTGDDEQQRLYKRIASSPGKLLSDTTVQHMHHMLRETVRVGTGRRAQLSGVEVAGKTGTSQSYRDAWFVGYTPHFVAGVWLGNDDNSSMDHVTGGSLPAQLWRDVMQSAYAFIQPETPLTFEPVEAPLPWLDDSTTPNKPERQPSSGGNWFEKLFELVPDEIEVDVEYDYPKPRRN